MKKIIAAAAALMFLCAGSAGAEEINVLADGKALFWEGQQAVIENDSVLIPFRVIFESLGARVYWLPETKSVVAVKGLNALKFAVGEKNVNVNGEDTEISAAPEIMNDTTMVPLRAMSELLGAEVDWHQDTRTVTIKTDEAASAYDVGFSEREYRADDNTLVMKSVVSYPILTDTKTTGLRNINEYFKKHADDMAGKFIDSFGQKMKDEYDAVRKAEEPFEALYTVSGMEILYDKGNFLSAIEQAEVAGQAVVMFDAVNFDKESGKVLEKKDLVSVSDEEMQSLEDYSFYLSEDEVILFLNSDKVYLYQYYGYPLSMQVPRDYVKYDLETGEKKDIITGENGWEVGDKTMERKTFKTLAALNKELGFKMASLKDETKDVPAEYAAIDGIIGETVYSNGNFEMILRKGKKLPNLSGLNGEKVKEVMYKNVNISYFKTDSCIYSTFTLGNGEEVYNYSLLIKDIAEQSYLERITREIIDIE